jgi:hypothetical protein
MERSGMTTGNGLSVYIVQVNAVVKAVAFQLQVAFDTARSLGLVEDSFDLVSPGLWRSMFLDRNGRAGVVTVEQFAVLKSAEGIRL